MQEVQADVAVIGGGPGGYAAAFHAADLGKSVTIIEPEPLLGGACLIRGCIPSKALITAAEQVESIRAAHAIGIETGPVVVHMDRLSRWRQSVIQQIGKGLNELAKRRNVRWLRGRATFQGPAQLLVECVDGMRTPVHFRHAVIATGAQPVFPGGFEPDGHTVIGSTEALELDRVPGRLLVIGGGYIGLELGSCFRLLGSSVCVVELTSALLPGTDPELVRPVSRKLQARGVRVLLESRVVAIERGEDEARVQIVLPDGSCVREAFDRVLVCVGRGPNTSGLALSRAGVAVDARGYVTCDDQRQTTCTTIFAVGDCCGGPLLAHKARRDGIVAAEALCGRPARRDQKTVPAVIFSDPEIATCGMSEADAAAAGRAVRIGRFPFAALGRAQTHRATDGIIKLIADADSGQLLGAGIVGAGASELIAEATLAIELGATIDDLMHTIHAHPTLAEGIAEAAELVHGASLHIYKKARPGGSPAAAPD